MEKSDRAAEIGKRLGRAFKAAKPHARRLAAQAKPRVEKVGQDAIRLARNHETEIKQAAEKLIRKRIRGPLGFVVDALTSSPGSKGVGSLQCANCRAINQADAKFCNQCGSRLDLAL